MTMQVWLMYSFPRACLGVRGLLLGRLFERMLEWQLERVCLDAKCPSEYDHSHHYDADYPECLPQMMAVLGGDGAPGSMHAQRAVDRLP